MLPHHANDNEHEIFSENLKLRISRNLNLLVLYHLLVTVGEDSVTKEFKKEYGGQV